MSDENKKIFSFDPAAEPDVRLALLYEIGRVLASSKTMDEAAPPLLETIGRHLRFERGELWCLGKGATHLKLESVWHLSSPPLDKNIAENSVLEFARGDGLPGKAWASNAPVWIENLNGADGAASFFADAADLRSGFAFPISIDGKIVGACSFFSAETRRADDALRRMFAVVGNHVGQFIRREKIESSLRESDDRYRAFIAQSTEGIWRYELDEKISVALPVEEQIKLAFERGYLAECNDAMARMYGLERAADLIGKRLTDLFDMADAANVEYLRAFIESGYNLIDAESHEKDARGNDKFFLNSLTGVIENGFLIRAWGTQRDLTEQKEIEKTARGSENQMRVLTDAIPALISYIDSEHRYRFVNQAYSSWFENVNETVVGKTMTEALGEAAFQKVRPFVEGALAGEKQLFETEIEFKDGINRFIQATYTPNTDGDGAVRGFFVLVLDISDRKRAERRLALLAEISEMIRTSEKPDDLLFAVSKSLGEHLGARRCLFNEIDLERDLEIVYRDYCRGAESVAGAHRISDYSASTLR